MGNSLSEPIVTKESIVYTSSTGLGPVSKSMQGYRLHMEDTTCIMDMPTRQDHLFLGLFDGHGGKYCADFAAKNLVSLLEKTDEWRKYNEGIGGVEMLKAALRSSFEELDFHLRARWNYETGFGDGNEDDIYDGNGGSTAIVAIVTPHWIVCANAGDSRCVLGSEGRTIALSEDHKPNNEGERARILKAGARVINKRVNGDVAVSRAFGDFAYKNREDLPASEQPMTCVPDIKVHSRAEGDEVLVLACDGLWDVCTSDEVLAYIREREEKSTEEIAENLADFALAKDSKDNISVILMNF